MKANFEIGALHCRALLVSVILLGFALPALTQEGTPNRNTVQLPEGAGKAIVQRACTVCHDLERVVRPGNTPEAWQLILDNMVSLGTKVSADEVKVAHQYLSSNFPDRGPKPKLVPGPIEVTIREWNVPSKGSRPHDPLAAKDGTVWYTGQYVSVLGHFDPKTERFGEYKLRAGSNPHGLIDDAQGNIWFTAEGADYVGKLDPKTGFITEYKMSHPAAHNPQTPIIAPNGDVFFTTGLNSMLGKIDVKTGKMTIVEEGPRPTREHRGYITYGMRVNSKGIPIFALYGINKIGSLDPQTMKVTEYDLPRPGSRVRRLTVTPDDVIWYADYAEGYLGSYDPKTGKFKEWPSPSGPDSLPYGIANLNGIVWYTESGTRPNTIVRFDPKTEKFQSWAIPSGGGVVRHIDADKNGNLWLAESGQNKIGVVEIKSPTARASSAR
jgi:virginiamycin B lyase